MLSEVEKVHHVSKPIARQTLCPKHRVLIRNGEGRVVGEIHSLASPCGVGGVDSFDPQVRVADLHGEEVVSGAPIAPDSPLALSHCASGAAPSPSSSHESRIVSDVHRFMDGTQIDAGTGAALSPFEVGPPLPRDAASVRDPLLRVR